MYDNIGGKIKGLAIAGFIIETILTVLLGIVLMVFDKDIILLGLLVIVVGPMVSWISSWLLYGFGELIENSSIIADNSYIIAENSNGIAESNNDYTADYEEKDA